MQVKEIMAKVSNLKLKKVCILIRIYFAIHVVVYIFALKTFDCLSIAINIIIDG